MSARLGKISLGLAVVPFLLNVCMWGLSIAAIVHDPHWGNTDSLPRTIIAIVVMLSPLGHLIGVGTGIASLIKREPQYGFAIGGLVLNSLLLVGAGLFFVMSIVFAGV